jgi:hypothetical protein
MMLATPTAPTKRATAPKPKKRLSKAPCASAWATNAAVGAGKPMSTDESILGAGAAGFKIQAT